MPFSRRNLLQACGIAATAAVARGWNLPAPAIVDAAVHGQGLILLNSNENAYGPSERTLVAMRKALTVANRYPFEVLEALPEALAAKHHVSTHEVAVGCGSIELLRAAANGLAGSQKRLVMGDPTFEPIAHYSESSGGEVIKVPLTKSFSHDLPAMLHHAGAQGTLFYICNPNNPTASLTPRHEIDDFLGKLPPNSYVLIDEAYHEYAVQSGEYTSFLDRRSDNPNMIVTRTFSKVYGLAGLRIGYAIGSAAVLKRIRPWLSWGNLNVVGGQAALAALADAEAVRLAVKRNANDRQEFFNQAQARMLHPMTSHTNFCLVNTGMPAQKTVEFFRQKNILIARPSPPLDTFVRVSLGTPPQMRQFWKVWDTMPQVATSM